MKSLFKKDLSKKRNTVVLVNKVDMPKDYYGDKDATSLSFGGKMWM